MLKRILLVLLPWLLCGPALVLSLSMGLGAGLETYGHATHTTTSIPEDVGWFQVAVTALIAVTVPAAWLALLVMTVAWVRQRRLQALWPRAGTMLAVLGLLGFGMGLGPMGLVMAVVYASPGIMLALLLCRYHLYGPAAPAQAAEPTPG